MAARLAPHVAAAIAAGRGAAAQAKPAVGVRARHGPAPHVAASIAAARRVSSPAQAKSAAPPPPRPAPHVAAAVAYHHSGAVLQRSKLRAKDMKEEEFYLVDDVPRKLTWMNSNRTRFKFEGLDKPVNFQKVQGLPPQEDLSSSRVVGAPPSTGVKIGSGKKYSNLTEYAERKKEKQMDREHVPTFVVSKTLAGASGGAEHVSLVLQIAGGKPVVVAPGQGSTEHAELFRVPFTQHNHEIDTSENDAEVSQLSHAYGLCLQDLENNAVTLPDEARLHFVALVGPWGPCDGCKERIRAFKSAWQQAATEHQCSARLVLTYFYRYEGRPIERQGETFYGYVEALPGTDLNLRMLGKKKGVQAPKDTYWYRSTGATFEFTG